MWTLRLFLALVVVVALVNAAPPKKVPSRWGRKPTKDAKPVASETQVDGEPANAPPKKAPSRWGRKDAKPGFEMRKKPEGSEKPKRGPKPMGPRPCRVQNEDTKAVMKEMACKGNDTCSVGPFDKTVNGTNIQVFLCNPRAEIRQKMVRAACLIVDVAKDATIEKRECPENTTCRIGSFSATVNDTDVHFYMCDKPPRDIKPPRPEGGKPSKDGARPSKKFGGFRRRGGKGGGKQPMPEGEKPEEAAGDAQTQADAEDSASPPAKGKSSGRKPSKNGPRRGLKPMPKKSKSRRG